MAVTELRTAVITVENLPRTSTGKIQKNVVREQLAGHHTGDAG
jgi:acyl-coenzyme A synthetase/AMP-(fatty) acid ligase